MAESLDMLLLARLQFAFTISFHIIFPAFSIGLASYLVMLEALWLKTGRDTYMGLYRMWVKVFAVTFGMGVVSGLVMSYQFGTNWSVFSEQTGNVLGPLLGYEVLTAFFLEASFLGIMLFGMKRVGPYMHFIATTVVAIGTLISAFWILAANSWMHTPAGYELRDGVFYATDWLEVIFNPSFPYRFVHMVLAAYLTTSLVVAAVAAFHLLRGTHREAARTMMFMAFPFIAIVATLQVVAGHEHGVNVHEHQPAKLAAMEGVWETERGVPLLLFALPSEADERNHLEVRVPKMASLVVTGELDGEIRGLKEWPADERPPVAIVFWSFRVMVGLGLLMLGLGIVGSWLLKTGRLESRPWFLRATMAMGPTGFVAVLTGWITAEVGRQPYTVYGLLRTADSVSPVTAGAVGMSLIVFIFVYGVVFTAGIYYMLRLMAQGPDIPDEPPAPPGAATPRLATEG